MSKVDTYKNMTNVPPPYEQQAPPQHGQSMSSFPQADPSYGYDQGPRQTQSNVVNIQSGVQPQTIVLTAPEPIPNMAAHITMSCLVFWFCSPLFGCIAFFIAIAGSSANSPAEARSLGKASLGVNIAGILITVITVAVLVGLYLGGGLFVEDYADDFVHDYENYGR